MRTMSLDPGTDGCGFAIWDDYGTNEDWKRIEPPIRVGTLPAPTEFVEWLDRSVHIANRLHATMLGEKVRRLFCEIPTYMGNTGRGYAATADGSIYKLSMHIGSIQYVCYLEGIEFIEVPVRVWKGQLKKEHIESRIIKILGADVCEKLRINSHGWDAVGLGLYGKGHHFDTGR